MSCCPPDTAVDSFWSMHLLLDSSFEHADNMDLQPSTKKKKRFELVTRTALEALHIVLSFQLTSIK